MYFDQLSGACSTRKLVETFFSAVFRPFLLSIAGFNPPAVSGNYVWTLSLLYPQSYHGWMGFSLKGGTPRTRNQLLLSISKNIFCANQLEGSVKYWLTLTQFISIKLDNNFWLFVVKRFYKNKLIGFSVLAPKWKIQTTE